MEYKDRNYRSRFAGDNRRWFSVKFLESDLWIGVDSGSYSQSMEADTYALLVDLRRAMDAYLLMDPQYKAAMQPYRIARGKAHHSIQEYNCEAGSL